MGYDLVRKLPYTHPYRYDGRQFGGPKLWTPSEITTRLWFDAYDEATITEAAGSISQWDDKSGNADHLIQGTGANQPTFGLGTEFPDMNVIKTTSSQYMATAGDVTINNTNSIFVVFAQQAQSRDYITSIGSDTHYVGTTSANNMPFVHDGTNMTASALSADTQYLFSCRNAASDYNFYLNGTSELSSTEEPNLYDGVSGFRFVINSRQAAGSQLGGDLEIAEIIYINSQLSDADRQIVEGYLAHKWDTVASLPGGHPYKTLPPTV